MKKIVLFWCALLFSTAMFAQSNVTWLDVFGQVVFKGGYNLLEKQPVAAADIRADIGFIRAQVEIGYAPFDNVQAPPIPFSPSIGLTCGDIHIFYLLVGGQPWGALFTQDEKSKFDFETWHVRFEGGVDFRLSDLLFINVSAVYLLPHKDTETSHHYQNLSVLAGLGFNF